MNRRGDLEITINTRILERCAWLALVLVLAAVLWWRWDVGSASGSADADERIATLESQLSERDARISSLEAQKTSAATPVKANVTAPPAVPAPPVPAAPVVVQVNNTVATSNPALVLRWTQSGSRPASGKYKLEQVTLIAENGFSVPVGITYNLCWASLDCERAVSKGNFTAKESTTTEFTPVLTIPTYVDIVKGQRLRLTLFNSTSKVELLREEITIR